MPQNVKRLRREPAAGGLVPRIGRNLDWLRQGLDIKRWDPPDLINREVRVTADVMGWPIFKSSTFQKFDATINGAGAAVDSNVDSGVQQGFFRWYWIINMLHGGTANTWPRSSLRWQMDAKNYHLETGDHSPDANDVIVFHNVIVPEGGRLGYSSLGISVPVNNNVNIYGLSIDLPHGTYIPHNTSPVVAAPVSTL